MSYLLLKMMTYNLKFDYSYNILMNKKHVFASNDSSTCSLMFVNLCFFLGWEAKLNAMMNILLDE